MYHLLCPSFPTIKSIDGSRRKAVAARWRVNPSLDTFRELFITAEESSFLKGDNDRNWSADFDWMMKQGNFTKILERRYDDKDRSSSPLAQLEDAERQAEKPKRGSLVVPKDTKTLTVGAASSFDVEDVFTAALIKSYGYDPRETGITYGDNAGGAQ